MKVFNLTDVETPVLKQHGMVNHTFAVGALLLGPGDSGDLPSEKESALRTELQRLVGLGALSANELPPAYLARKKALEVKAARPPSLPPKLTEPTTSPGVRRKSFGG
jgi:hypothetical protein